MLKITFRPIPSVTDLTSNIKFVLSVISCNYLSPPPKLDIAI